MPPVTLQTLIASTASQAATPALTPGTVVQAMVAQLLDELTMRLQLPGGATLDVKGDQPLAQGTRVQVSVEGTTAQPKILLTPLPALPQAAPAGKGPASTQTLPPPGAPSASGPAQPSAGANAAPTTPSVATAIDQPKPLPAAVQAVLPTIDTAPKQTLQAQLLQAAVTQMVREAVAKQSGLAPLMADAQAALARPDLPPPVRAAIMQLLALRLPANTPVTAPDIKAVVVNSGIAGDPASLQPAQSPNTDLKAVLQTLRDALTNWIKSEEGPADPKLALAPRPAPAVPPQAQRAALPPPHRLGPTVPQPPSPASLPDEAGASDAAEHLLAKTEGALARQTLLQIASLPDEQGAHRSEASGPRLTLDIPLGLPQGTAVAQLRIEQDAARGEGPDLRPIWRANFSIDIEPIGPVHAAISMFGERAAVTLYAERDDSAERLREGLPLLEAGLNDAALEAGELRCRAGAPVAPRSAPGLFVDQAS